MESLKELFVSYDIAKRAKKHGFNSNDEPSLGYYLSNKKLLISDLRFVKDMANTLKLTYISAPIYQQIITWLTTKGIYIEMLIDGWGLNDNKISDEYICFRTFLWEIGKPKPQHNSDIGAHQYYKILEVTIEHALDRLDGKIIEEKLFKLLERFGFTKKENDNNITYSNGNEMFVYPSAGLSQHHYIATRKQLNMNGHISEDKFNKLIKF